MSLQCQYLAPEFCSSQKKNPIFAFILSSIFLEGIRFSFCTFVRTGPAASCGGLFDTFSDNPHCPTGLNRNVYD